ncbi:MAG: S8 family serine peptidase [Gaiellaceae bacterium MAG52_C11]|nr:S8 family serine peptidase [Candidatus Gaiellasilicea maunaloa]
MIVRTHDASFASERLVQRVGGSIDRRLPLIDGFLATVPSKAIERLRVTRGVASVTVDRRVRLSSLSSWDPKTDLGSLYYVAQEVTGAGEYWNDGYTGKGVDVALIDSGVTPVAGLVTPDKVVLGPDLSFESQSPELRNLDTYGHGTHLAGIIAGRDDSVPTPVQKGEETFVGMAPDARIVSIKVADSQGSTDVSQVIAAIDWVVQHRRDNGLNIRVLNLSFGTDSEQDYRVDPLAYAVEVAWRKGIVVVVAAGNGGFGSEGLNSPASDPSVIAVGGADGNGTYDWLDDTVPSWSSWGTHKRRPDLVAPGKSIVSLRVPGSSLDLAHPGARIGASRFFRGSGTSQAAAVVSGAAALIIQQRPTITPDGVKALLVESAQELPKAKKEAQGGGMLNLKLARDTRTPRRLRLSPAGTGGGSLDLARGSSHLQVNGAVLSGERDIFGAPFDSGRWAALSLAGNAWSGGTWNGNAWSGDAWSSGAWSGNAWSGNAWSGNAWSGNAWSGNAWSGNAWSGNAWSGNAWSGNAWSGNAWSGNAWSGSGWGP